MQMPLVLTNRRRRGGSASAPAFSPTSLYSSGSQGIWLDPSDLSTMFSDRAGTIQVTTPGTVVGKRLDKSGRGNHAVAPTDAARPTYGIEPKGGRRNLLTWSEDFRNTAAAGENRPWTNTAVTITANTSATTDPTGGNAADKIAETTATSDHNVVQAVTSSDTTAIALSVYLKAAERTWARISCDFGVGGYRRFWVNLATGAVGTVDGATATLLSGPTITDVGNGWYRCTLVASAASGTTRSLFVATATGDAATSFAGTTGSGIYMYGAQLELGSTATNYQRVTTAYDVTESGVDTCHYVQYDGSDDSMSTAAIDFTATDKMSVFAGVRKLSNATAIIAELSVSVDASQGSFHVASNALNNSNQFISKGIFATTAIASGPASPASIILAGLSDISGDRATLRVDGLQVAQSTVDQGTGNFGNYPLFIGRRNNASLPFNGRDYGIIIVGKAASAGEITDTETWLAAKTSGVSI